jgi:hypothetical protein
MTIATFTYKDKKGKEYTFRTELGPEHSIFVKLGIGAMCSCRTLGIEPSELFKRIGKEFDHFEDYVEPMITLRDFEAKYILKEMHDVWDFVERFHPNYSNSDEICRANDIELKKETEELTQDEADELNYLLRYIYEEAIENFINR